MKRHFLPYLCLSLLLMLGLAVFSWKSFKAIGVSTSIHDVMSTDERSRETFEKFDEAFSSKTVVVALLKIDDLFSDKGVRQLYEVSEALEAMPDLTDIKSLTHSSRPVKRGFNFDIRKTIFLENFLTLAPKSEVEWKRQREFITAYPMTRDILVSSDGQYATVLAVLSDKIKTLEQKKLVMKQARAQVQPFVEKGMEIHFLSEPFITAEFHDLVLSFIKQFVLASFVLICVVIYLSFRSFKILSLMMLYQAGGLLACPIVFYLNLTDLNVYTMVVLPLVSAIQLTFLTHFYSVYQDETQNGGGQACVLRRTLKVVFRPSLLALLTSMVGMSSLYFSEMEILKPVGQIGALCLMAVFVLSFGPAWIMSLPARKKELKDFDEQVQDFPFLNFLKSRSKVILILALFLFGSSLILSSKISTDLRAKEFLDEKSETRQSLELLDAHFGGINVFQIDVKTEKTFGIQRYEVIKYLYELRRRALEIEGVRNAYTYSQFYTTIHQLFLGDNLSKGDVLPDEAACYTYNMIINAGKFPFQDTLQNEQRSQTLFLLRTDDLPSGDFLKIVQEFKTLLDEDKPEGLELEVQEGIHTLLESDRGVLRSQLNSLGSSLIAILLLLMILWRSWSHSFIVLISNLLPLMFLVLMMYVLGIALNSVTVMVSSIILGIAVDDSIHFLSYYRREKKAGREALKLTLKHKLRPMICTTTVLVICFSLFLLAPFPPMRDFGLLGAGGLLAALASSCFFLPVLLNLTEKKVAKIYD